MPDNDGALAVALLKLAAHHGTLLHIVARESRVERLGRLAWAFAPETETVLLPGWDCLPYDRVSPSSRNMGLRTSGLTALTRPAGRPRLVLATVDGLVRRVPPKEAWDPAAIIPRRGNALDLDALRADLLRTGHREDDRVDEPGEFAIRGHVVDLYPAGYYLPVRIEHDAGRIASVASYDPATQRRTDEFDELQLRPSSEAILAAGDGTDRQGLEHRLPELFERLDTVLDYLPDAAVAFEPGTEERRALFLDQVRDAYETRVRLGGLGPRPVAPERLYQDGGDIDRALAGREVIRFRRSEAKDETVPQASRAADPARTLSRLVRPALKAGTRVLAAAPSLAAMPAMLRRVERASGRKAVPVRSWDEAAAAGAGTLLAIVAPLERGFSDPETGILVLSGPDVLGRSQAGAASDAAALLGEERFGIGDAVIHLEHGVGLLEGIESIETEPGRVTETIRLRYAGDATLMVPVDGIGLMWRYGASAEGVSLDRLGSASWPKRRAKVEAELRRSAAELARLAAERAAVQAPRLVPPADAYEGFARRFPFGETPDQAAAIDDVLRDLASGRVMDRLVCGDVGFGKTEVALRAAAAAAFSGRQVAVVAPTTVLVRQHLQTFGRRFAGLGIAVGHLSRLSSPQEAKEVKAGLADGRIRIVVGTHALAGKGVSFADLGLLIIDEEQRFGAAHKTKLRALGETPHVLTLTATPIPRTLQSALVGLQEVSVLATPPAERQPVRTVVSAQDDATMREALLREKRRGGQGFVVCPRIEDIGPMEEHLRRLAPELDLLVAHGKLPAAASDSAMVRFADGEGDVLLATNIIESGLDVPRANTILVVRADLFGLAQLHQLRGRVGRGGTRGTAYLLTEVEPSASVAKRLGTLGRLDRLGSGFAISAEDLDQRGAGDLLGETQAGHVRLIGAGLYRRLLERALIEARGETPPEEWVPELNVGLSGFLPADYIPEPELRLNLYARLERTADPTSEAGLADEMEDRFGPPPGPVANLLALNRLRRLCRDSGITRVDAGPQAVAFTFKSRGPEDPAIAAAVAAPHGELAWKGRRLVAAGAVPDGPERLTAVEALIGRLDGADAAGPDRDNRGGLS